MLFSNRDLNHQQNGTDDDHRGMLSVQVHNILHKILQQTDDQTPILLNVLTLGWMFLTTGKIFMTSSSLNVCLFLLSRLYSLNKICTPHFLQNVRRRETLLTL